jgi:hypothetical protein
MGMGGFEGMDDFHTRCESAIYGTSDECTKFSADEASRLTFRGTIRLDDAFQVTLRGKEFDNVVLIIAGRTRLNLIECTGRLSSIQVTDVDSTSGGTSLSIDGGPDLPVEAVIAAQQGNAGFGSINDVVVRKTDGQVCQTITGDVRNTVVDPNCF